jgi:hypothetical protein
MHWKWERRSRRLLIQVVHKLFASVPIQLAFLQCVFLIIERKHINNGIKWCVPLKSLFALHLNGAIKPSSKHFLKKKETWTCQDKCYMADPSMPWTHPPSSLLGAVYPIIPHGRGPHIWGGEGGSSSSPHMNEERVVA